MVRPRGVNPRGGASPLITNEFICARVYAGSARMENLHGGGLRRQDGARVDRGIRRLGRISVSFCARSRCVGPPLYLWPHFATTVENVVILWPLLSPAMFRLRTSAVDIGTACVLEHLTAECDYLCKLLCTAALSISVCHPGARLIPMNEGKLEL